MNEMIDVARALSSVVQSAVQTTVQPGVSLKLVLKPSLPNLLEGDLLIYRQVIGSIIGNAGKFTEQGSLLVHVDILVGDKTRCTILTEVKNTRYVDSSFSHYFAARHR
jgi:signal transduction histidine kinase